MGLLGILIALAGLIFFAFRGTSILILAPIAGLIAAAVAAGPLHGYGGLLRPRHERPRHRATDQRDKLAPLHCHLPG